MELNLSGKIGSAFNVKSLFIYCVVVISIFPFILSNLDFDFATPVYHFDKSEVLNKSNQDLMDEMAYIMNGIFVHTILEWSAVCISILIALVSFFTFKLKPKSFEVPIIGFALFFSGCMDAFHTLATSRLIEGISHNNDFIPYTWTFSRLFNVVAIIIAVFISVLIHKKNLLNISNFNKKLFYKERGYKIYSFYMLAIAFLFGILSFVFIYFSFQVEKLNQSMIVNFSLESIPLVLWIIAIPIMFWFLRKRPSFFTYALLIMIIPQCILEMHMVYGSESIFDSHFNIAHFLKIITYAVPMFGLVLSYIHTYKLAEEKFIDLNKYLEDKVKERTQTLEKQSSEIKSQNEALEKAQAEVISQYYQIQNQNKELEKAKAVANEANQSKSMFIANMSHEIRTPLNAVMGFAEILKEKLHEYPEYQNYLDGIYVGGRNLLNLINDILDISKIEAGKLSIQYKTVDIYETLREIKQLFINKIEKKGLQFEINVKDNIPSALILDEGRLRQILFNLVGNAIKFTEEGNISISLKVSENKHSSTYNMVIEVQDTGIGIQRNQQKTIFEPFHQQKDQDTKYGGTGLGLSITKRLVEMMNGTISLKSTLGKGTTFKITLTDINVGALADVEILDIDKKIKVRFEKAKILLVEDIKSNRDVIKGYLELHNITIIEAENGEKAIESANVEVPDLILMDLQMPVLNGFETSKILKEKEHLKNVPIIALTASTVEPESNVRNVCDEYIRKPVSKQLLIKTLAKYLPHTRLEEEDLSEGKLKNDYLNTLEIYLQENQRFPYELIYIIQDELKPLFDEIQLTLSIDESKKFSFRMIKLGEDFNIEPLTDYGKELLQEINLFKFEEFKLLLKLFPEILTIINKKTSSYGRK